MDIKDTTTRPLLRDYLKDLLNVTSSHAIQTPSRATLIATLLALDNAPFPTRPPPIQSHLWRALLPETPNWYWDKTATGAMLQSTQALEVTPFSPATLVSLSETLSTARIVHTLFSAQPYESTRPFYAQLQGGPDTVAIAVKKIIEEIAKRFNDMYPLYVLTCSHSNNSSSLAAVEPSVRFSLLHTYYILWHHLLQHTAPPRKHATRRKHKHDKRDP
jgi:hypothetical protein